MQPQVKTPIQITQELIALHTTRIEATERLKEKVTTESDMNMLAAAQAQSEQYTAQLMDELSTFGDAILSSVDKENAYHALWTKAIADIDTMDASTAGTTFRRMGKVLSEMYKEYADLQTELPTALQEIIKQQTAE